MAHWFHRNVFKATTVVNFESVLVQKDAQAVQLCSQLKQARQGLLQMLPDVNYSIDTVEAAFNSYLSLLYGFIHDPTSENAPSKLRCAITFKWTNTLLGGSPQIEKDSLFEAACMSCNVAIWYMKHASMIAGKDDINMEEAKDVHKSLRKAAGIFQFVESLLMPQLPRAQLQCGDLDPRIIATYITQSTAEAQEVTLARAVELKHNPTLISALANETAKMFSEAANNLGSLERAQQWKLYLELKAAFYRAFAYRYCGENLLSLDKCGEAIRALQEALSCYGRAADFGKEYAKKKGPSPKAVPENHPFFKRLAPLLKFTLEKCERENGFIYHQKVPFEAPVLEQKASYGLVNPDEFSLPPAHKLWNPSTYGAFDDFSTQDSEPIFLNNGERDLPPVKEVPVHQTSKEPKNESGCSVQ